MQYQQWVNVLTKELPENEKRFENILKQCGGQIPMALMTFRRDIYNEGRWVVDTEKIKHCNHDSDIVTLLSEIFLEYIDKDQIPGIKRIMEFNNWTLEKLYIAQQQNSRNGSYKRLLRVISCPCEI